MGNLAFEANVAAGVANDGEFYPMGSSIRPHGSATVVKYYFFNGQRVAQRRAGVVQYLLGDHLGTTSVVVAADGSMVAEGRYLPYGGQRWNSGTLPTDYRFTGQRYDAYIQLYAMGARHYDPELGRWISADTLVPNPSNPQSFNRYSYVGNRPLRYVDPSGHLTEEELRTLLGDDYEVLWNLWNTYDPYWVAVLDAIDGGDVLLASILGDSIELHFEGRGEGIQVFVHGAFSADLKAWQAKGAYLIKKPGMNETDEARLRDQLFDQSCNGLPNTYTAPVFDYGSREHGNIDPIYLGARLIQQHLGEFQWTGTGTALASRITGISSNNPGDWLLDALLLRIPDPISQTVGAVKLFSDLVVSVVYTYQAPKEYSVGWPGGMTDVSTQVTLQSLSR